MTAGIDRRHAVTGAAAVALGLPVLAACGGNDDSGTATDPTTSSPSPESPGASETSGGSGGAPLARAADVPVGGCLVVADAKVVLTQPTEGEFKAFSAACTHQGCTVSSSSDGEIPCSCHGSRFSIEDGSVLQGPATSALPEVPIEVDGDAIRRA